MPIIWVYEGTDGGLQINNGVTRATRVAKLSPGSLVRVEVIGRLPGPVGHLPRIGDLLSMIDPVRKEILRLLEQLIELAPDVRFGQLIANLSYLAIAPTNEAIWDMEDEQLLEAIRQHIADLSHRESRIA